VLGTGVFTELINNGNATIDVGNNGLLSGIQGELELLNASGSDAIFLDNSSDDVGQTFNFDVTPGFETLNQFGLLSGTVMSGTISWDNTVTSRVNLFGGSGGDTYNIFATASTTTILGGFGANTFNVLPIDTQQGSLGANIQRPLTLDGGGNANTTLDLNDFPDPNSPTFNFAISLPGTGSLTLGGTPSFSLAFDSMGGGVFLTTNGSSVVNDPSGTVNIPPAAKNLALTSPIQPGHSSTLSGQLADATGNTNLTLTVNWGDGSKPQRIRPGLEPFALKHKYRHMGTYTVHASWSDNHGLSNSRNLIVVVGPHHAKLATRAERHPDHA
jgi:hypothetical protein